jgi:hypothetical protein
MAFNAVVAHRTSGRVRLRIREKRGDEAFFFELSELLQEIDTVQAVRANAMTGSVVIEYAGDFDGLAELMKTRDIIVEKGQEPAASPVKESGTTRLSAPIPLNIVSGREITPMFMIGVLLAGVGVVQIFRGRVLVPAMSGFWMAMVAFCQSGRAR